MKVVEQNEDDAIGYNDGDRHRGRDLRRRGFVVFDAGRVGGVDVLLSVTAAASEVVSSRAAARAVTVAPMTDDVIVIIIIVVADQMCNDV